MGGERGDDDEGNGRKGREKRGEGDERVKKGEAAKIEI